MISLDVFRIISGLGSALQSMLKMNHQIEVVMGEDRALTFLNYFCEYKKHEDEEIRRICAAGLK